MAPAVTDRPAAKGEGARPFLSIIMPCYGVAGFLPQAFRGIQAQTCGDWELVCVDDASPDDGAALIERAAAADPRIRLVRHEVNRGIAGARTTGLRAARGRYAWFADADDRFEPDTVESIRSAAERDGEPDVVAFGIVEEDIDPAGAVISARTVVPPMTGLVAGREVHRGVLALEEATLYGYATTKAYRTALARDIAFERVPLIEDFLFNAAVFDRARTVSYIGRALYHYEKRQSGNLTARFVPEYYEVHRRRIQTLFDQQRRWGLDGAETRARLGSLYARYILSALERNCDPRAGMSHADRVAWCRSVMGDDLYRALVPGARSRGSRALEACLRVLRTGSPAAWLALGRAVHAVRGGAKGLYVSLRRGR